jgi:hypothetical protein
LAGEAAYVTVAGSLLCREIGEILHPQAGVVKALRVVLDPSS